MQPSRVCLDLAAALWITDRSGHTTLSMLRRYERDVRRWRELGEVAPVDAHAAIPASDATGRVYEAVARWIADACPIIGGH